MTSSCTARGMRPLALFLLFLNHSAIAQTWSVNGTSYYYNGGNVGIGTNVPAAPLDVNGATRDR